MRKKVLLFLLAFIIVFGKNLIFAETNVVNLEEIAGDTIYSVFYYDTSFDDDDSWRTNSSAGWYQEPYDPSDNFYGTSVNSHRWQTYANNGASVDCNFEVNLNTNGTKTGWVCGVYSSDRWSISGNFDIQIDFDDFSGYGNDGGVALYAYDGIDNYFYVRRRVGPSNRYDWDVIVSGNPVHYQFVNTSDTSGKLRLVRHITNVYAYFWDWNSSSWVQIGSPYNGFTTANLFVSFEIGVDNAYCSADLDNFIINYGTTNLGCYEKADRSSEQAFPERAILVCHENGLDIFDADDNEMWMRFDKRGSKNIAIHQNIVADHVEKVYAKNGKIYLTSSFGYMTGVAVIDFVNDNARFHDANPWDGWNYNASIAYRNCSNDIFGWYESTHAQLVNHVVHDFSVKEIDGTTYVAVATDGGITVINENYDTRNNCYGSAASAIEIGENGVLYFTCGNNFNYDVSSWKPGSSDGTFTSDYYFPLSGVQTLESSEDYLFIGFADGISKRSYDDVETELIHYDTENGILACCSNDVSDMEIYDKTLWVGTRNTRGDGCVSVIDIINDNLKTYFNEEEYGLCSNDVVSVSYSPNNCELIVGASSCVDHLSGTTGATPEPENIVISYIPENTIRLEWDGDMCAVSYKIYSSSQPYLDGEWQLEDEITDTVWETSVSSAKKFYYVIAEY